MDNIGIIDTYVTLDEVNILSIEKAISEVKPDLVIFDPISLYVGGSLDMNQANKVRQPMQRLQILAAKYNCAVVVVRHLNKGNSSKAMYRGQGSIDFIAAVRSAFIAVTNPDNQEERALHYNGGNICNELRPIGYVIQDTDDGVGVLKWTDVPPQFSLEKALAYQIPNEDEGSEKADATTLLLVMLEKREVPSSDIKEVAKREGISEKQLTTARGKLGVLIRWEGQGKDIRTYWSLPEKGRGDKAEKMEETEIVSSDSNNSGRESQLCPDESSFAFPWGKGQSSDKIEPNLIISHTFPALPLIDKRSNLKLERSNLEGGDSNNSVVQLCHPLCPSMDNGQSSETIDNKYIYKEKKSAMPSSYIEGIAEIERANLESTQELEEEEESQNDLDQATHTALSIIEMTQRMGINSPSLLTAKRTYERTGENLPD